MNQIEDGDTDEEVDNLLLGEMAHKKGYHRMGLFSTDNLRKCFFWIVQVLSLLIIVLTLIHIFNYRGGFGGRDSPKHEFCWHIFFMTLGFTFFLANSLLTFRLMPLMSKPKLKLIHTGLNTTVVICACLGLAFVIDEREIQGKAHFQSLHSWIGISAITLLVLQAVCGALVYLPSKTSLTWKEWMMPWHIKCGIAIFLLGIAAFLTGLKKGSTDSERYLLNFTGVCAIVLGFLVLHLLTAQDYKFTFRLK